MAHLFIEFGEAEIFLPPPRTPRPALPPVEERALILPFDLRVEGEEGLGEIFDLAEITEVEWEPAPLKR